MKLKADHEHLETNEPVAGSHSEWLTLININVNIDYTSPYTDHERSS